MPSLAKGGVALVLIPQALLMPSRNRMSKQAFCLVLVVVVVLCICYSALMTGDPVWPAGEGRSKFKSSHIHHHASAAVQPSLERARWDPLSIKFNLSLEHLLQVQPHCHSDALLQILITSAPANKASRDEIRKTWCSTLSTQNSLRTLKVSTQDPPWQCTFLVAKTHDSQLDQKVQQESSLYQDMLLGTYIDSYRNLTKKVISGFFWTYAHCKPKYVLKTDDDCFVNTPLLAWLLMQGEISPMGLYTGNIYTKEENRRVIRDMDSKWGLSWEDYGEELYPPYAAGPGYMLTLDVVQRMLQESQHNPPFAVEDAYMGVLSFKIGVTPSQSYRFALSKTRWSLCNFLYLLVVHQLSPTELGAMFTKSLEAVRSCKEEPIAALN